MQTNREAVGTSPAWSDLRARALVGVLLGLLALTCIKFGGWPFRTLVMVMGGGILLEWCEMTRVRPMALHIVGVVLFVAVCFVSVVRAEYMVGSFIVGLAFAIAMMALSYVIRQRTLFWWGLGFMYALLPSIALLWLRAIPQFGSLVVLWAIALVVAADTGAYFVGRLVGGPKLWPRISPKKTWSGFIGGAISAGIVGFCLAAASHHFNAWWVALASIILAGVAQSGDLAESSLKRAFGVKDSGHILPGHGGVMDRFDGLAFVAPVIALIWWFGARG